MNYWLISDWSDKFITHCKNIVSIFYALPIECITKYYTIVMEKKVAFILDKNCIIPRWLELLCDLL